MKPEAPGEFERIRRVRSLVGAPGAGTRLGIGDDTAIVSPPSSPLLLCTDAMVEGVHFDLRWSKPRDLGYKALSACLSDIAAMNGRALHVLLSLALPKRLPEEFLEAFYEGAREIAEECGCDIVGGDLSSSPSSLFIDVVAVGESSRPIRRSGAKPGDLVAVSGHPGDSAAGLHALKNDIANGTRSLIKAHLRPKPRFDLLHGLNKSEGLCTAMIDISDGLSSDLGHIAENSNVGFIIEEKNLPISDEAKSLARNAGLNALDWALSGGEDYELLVTLDEDQVRQCGIPSGLMVIGKAVPQDQGLNLLATDGRKIPLRPTGFDHFASR